MEGGRFLCGSSRSEYWLSALVLANLHGKTLQKCFYYHLQSRLREGLRILTRFLSFKLVWQSGTTFCWSIQAVLEILGCRVGVLLDSSTAVSSCLSDSSSSSVLALLDLNWLCASLSSRQQKYKASRSLVAWCCAQPAWVQQDLISSSSASHKSS